MNDFPQRIVRYSLFILLLAFSALWLSAPKSTVNAPPLLSSTLLILEWHMGLTTEVSL